MTHFIGASTTNFGGAANPPAAPQANSFWAPEIYSKKVYLQRNLKKTFDVELN